MKEIAFDQDHYYPAVEPPDGANGELRSVAANKCVDTQFKGGSERFGLRKCISDDPSEGGEQNLRMSFWQDIRPMSRSFCFDASTSEDRAPVVLFACHGMKGNQHFQYKIAEQQIYHPINGHCLDCDPARGEIFTSPCNSTKQSQKWVWKNLNKEVVEERNKKS
jgi:polypeptide N-acetylgalactosaminyltransferase